MMMTPDQIKDAMRFMDELWREIEAYETASAAFSAQLCAGYSCEAEQSAKREWYAQRMKLRKLVGLSPEEEVPRYPGADGMIDSGHTDWPYQ